MVLRSCERGTHSACRPRASLKATQPSTTSSNLATHGRSPHSQKSPRRGSSLPDLAHLDGLRSVRSMHRGGALRSKELRVSEHMLPCAYGLLVPLSTLSMLLEDAELNSSVDGGAPTPSASKGRGGAGAAAEEEALLVSALDTTGWRSLAEWIREMHSSLTSYQQHSALPASRTAAKAAALASAAALQSSVRSGFKPAGRKQDATLSPMPTNLTINALEVRDEKKGAAVYHYDLARSDRRAFSRADLWRSPFDPVRPSLQT